MTQAEQIRCWLRELHQQQPAASPAGLVARASSIDGHQCTSWLRRLRWAKRVVLAREVMYGDQE